MDPRHKKQRRRSTAAKLTSKPRHSSAPMEMPFAALALLFLGSGISALCYEIAWSRMLGLLLGHTLFASTIVLVGFFLGMASGYWLASRLNLTSVSDLTLYGVLELIIGLWALCVPLFIDAATDYLDSAVLVRDSLIGLLILLPATCCLGATLPVLANSFDGQFRKSRSVSLIYAINTVGGLCGIFLATFLLIELVGVSTTNACAACLSLLCGGIAIFLGRGFAESRSASSVNPHVGRLTRPGVVIALASGLVTLLLQVAYTRMFALVFHNSTYTFALVVAVNLLGLAAGAFASAHLAGRRHFLTVSCTASAVLVALSPLVFAMLTEMQYFRGGSSLVEHVFYASAVVAAVTLLPVIALGTLLPTAWKLTMQKNATDARYAVGRLTALNSLAAASGAGLASFALLPTFGLWGTFLVATIILCGLLLYLRFSSRTVVFASLCIAISFIATQQPYSRAIPQGAELVRRWESGYGWIEILKRRFDGVQLLRQDVQYGLGADLDINWERRQGRLPLMLHPHPRDVAFLGIGTGISVSAIVGDPAVVHVDAVELIPDVTEALPFFAEANLAFYEDPRCHVHATDARHFMRVIDKSYDVIVGDLFTPWHSRTGYLYTVEHFQNCRGKLRSGGIFCQWLPLWQLGANDFEIIADSFRSVFPRCTLWWGLCEPEKPLLCLIGSERALTISAKQFNARSCCNNQGRDEFLANTSRISHLYIGGWPKRYNCQLNTDDHPRVEFSCPSSDLRRAKLRGERIKEYFVEVLTRLPPDGVIFAADSKPIAIPVRLQWQHQQLSSSVKRGRSRPPAPRFIDQEAG